MSNKNDYIEPRPPLPPKKETYNLLSMGSPCSEVYGSRLPATSQGWDPPHGGCHDPQGGRHRCATVAWQLPMFKMEMAWIFSNTHGFYQFDVLFLLSLCFLHVIYGSGMACHMLSHEIVTCCPDGRTTCDNMFSIKTTNRLHEKQHAYSFIVTWWYLKIGVPSKSFKVNHYYSHKPTSFGGGPINFKKHPHH